MQNDGKQISEVGNHLTFPQSWLIIELRKTNSIVEYSNDINVKRQTFDMRCRNTEVYF